MIVRTDSEAYEFAKDILPSVKAVVKKLLSSSKPETALDYAKLLLDIQAFEFIDKALVLGYILEYMNKGKQAETESLSWIIAQLVAFTSYEKTPPVEFLFTLMKRSETSFSKDTFNDFMKLYSKLFYPDAPKTDEALDKPQLVSFIFRKPKHKKQICSIYFKLQLLGEVLDEVQDKDNEIFKEKVLELFTSNKVFKSQMTSLYAPARSLGLFIIKNSEEEEEQPYPKSFSVRCDNLECILDSTCRCSSLNLNGQVA